MNSSIDALNDRFGLAGVLRFEDGAAGLPEVAIQTPQASARIALHGAHVLAWQPGGQRPVIWVSRAAQFESGKSVRGGVPVCWPWFGARDGQALHGFVRTRLWQVRETSVDAGDQVVLRLGLVDDAATRALWDFAFDLELVVTVGAQLTMTLITRNTGAEPFTVTDALHTYFCVSDIGRTVVRGLEETDYLDKVHNFALVRQAGAVEFTGETDRIYLNTTSDCLIEDRGWQRTLRVSKTGSHSTVVWNPGPEREKTIADMSAGEHRLMLCVETCNAGPDQITVAPGAAHALTACISVL